MSFFAVLRNSKDPWIRTSDGSGSEPLTDPDPTPSPDLDILKESQNSSNQDFSYYFCLMIEGSGSGRPNDIWIRKTGFLSYWFFFISPLPGTVTLESRRWRAASTAACPSSTRRTGAGSTSPITGQYNSLQSFGELPVLQPAPPARGELELAAPRRSQVSIIRSNHLGWRSETTGSLVLILPHCIIWGSVPYCLRF